VARLASVESNPEVRSQTADTFTLVYGGPFHRWCLGTGRVEQTRRIAWRVGLAVALAWLPLLLLSAQQGLALGTRVRIPFLRDFAANARCLIALPLLILAEPAIDRKLRAVVRQFLSSGLVSGSDLPRFEALLKRVESLRNSGLAEVLLAVIAFASSWEIHTQEVLLHHSSTWHWMGAAAGTDPSRADWWFRVVSTPLFRFLFLRWLWRFTLWAIFLRGVSKLKLELTPIHPDLAGGLAFLAHGSVAFGVIALAGSTVMAGQLANALMFDGATLGGLHLVILIYCALAVLVLVAPLLLLIPPLRRVRNRGLVQYGSLAAQYTRDFQAKWVESPPPAEEALLGSADIQSLADLAGSFDIVKKMKVVPIDRHTLLSLVLLTAAPLLLVATLATPLDALLKMVIQLLA
jgi:hypothetical protein